MRARSMRFEWREAGRSLGFAALFLGLLAGCGPANTHSRPPTQTAQASGAHLADTLSVAAKIDSLAAAEEPKLSGLESVIPDLALMEGWYRSALQAVQNGDLKRAEQRMASVDSALAEVDDDEGDSVTAAYYDGLEARVDRLRDLMQEQRTVEHYISKVDSLSVINPDSPGGSLAEKRVQSQPAIPRFDLDLVENALTDRWVNFFTGDGRHYMDLWLTRLPRYEALIYKVLDDYNLPHDLIYLALIESGLSMQAHSKADAVGPWQFIASTGKMYGLKVDWWVDERRSIEMATRAAASHLSDLYGQFGSWPLALSAYNCGALRVQREIARSETRDFWKLTHLPSQTRNYVPKFMAALYIGKNPKHYGFNPADEEKHAYDVVKVSDATDLRLIAELAGCSLEQIVDLNPHIRRWCTPPGEHYDVKVPLGCGASCSEKLAQVPSQDRVTWRRHQVRRGDTLVKLARQYNTSVPAIQQANRLGTKRAIKPGRYLVIPVLAAETPGPRARKYILAAAKANVADTGPHRLTYVVRRGDTLANISRKHNVSVKQILRWNRKHSHRISVGERLRIYVPAD